MANRPSRKNPRLTLGDDTINPKLAVFHRLLNYKVRDVHALVLGDSTGAGQTRFTYLLAQKFANQYRDWTVIWAPWDDTTKTYVAGNKVTVQTGTSGRTLTIWNGSVSGQVIGYAATYLSQMTSGFTPDLVYFNYGHNSPQLASSYRAVHQPVVNQVANTFGQAAIIIGTQNPRDATVWATGSSGTTFSDDQGKQQAIAECAAANSLMCVDVNAAFLDYGPYGYNNATTDLLQSDGLHPNDTAGSPFWADVVWQAIKPGRRSAPVAPPISVTNRVWVPAKDFTALDGTPDLVPHGGVPAWALDSSTLESVTVAVDWPSTWVNVNITAIFATDAATAGNVRIQGDHQYVGARNGISSGVTFGTWSTSVGAFTQAMPNSALRVQPALMWNRTALGGFPVALKISRLGADAADTLTTDMLFLGLQIDQGY